MVRPWESARDGERRTEDPGPFPKLVFELALEPGERLRVPVHELGWTGLVRHVRERILGGRVRDAKPDDDRDKRDESRESTSSYVDPHQV